MIRGKFLVGALDDLSECFKIRRKVFIEEQHVSEEEEYDGLDTSCGHYLVYNEEDIPVATGRLIKVSDTVYKVGRVATLKAYRHKGYAQFLMLSLIEKARSLGGKDVTLLAQVSAVDFYKKCGFVVDNDEIIMDAGIEHKHMVYHIDGQPHDCSCQA